MYPELFRIGKIPVYSWGVMLSISFVVGALYSMRAGKKKGIDPDNVIDLALFVCIASIIFARILYVLLNISEYVSSPVSVFYMRDGGLSFFGGLAGGVLAGVLYCKKVKVNVGTMADVVAPAVAIGYSITRIGCLLNGCCYGVECSLPWALAAGPGSVLRHPTQIYSAIGSLIIFFILVYYLEPRKKFEGQIMWSYVGLYSILRFIVEFWRVSPRDYFAPFSNTQVLCVILGVLSFGVIWALAQQPSAATAGGAGNKASKPSTRA